MRARPFMDQPDMYARHDWVGAIFLLLVVLAVIAGTIFIVRMLVHRPHPGGVVAAQALPPQGASTPLQILEERFARGEIDEQEFRTRRDVLRG